MRGVDGLRLVAIDLDGTLVDSAPDLAQAVNAALDALGLAQASEADVRRWIGDGVEVLLRRALAEQGGDPPAQIKAALATFSAAYAAHPFTLSRLYAGVPETLARLRAHGLTLACITNKREDFARSVLERAGLSAQFDLLIGGDTLPAMKPDPLPLRTAAQKLGWSPSEAVMVGDSHHDLKAAVAAGFAFCWASYGYCADAGAMDPPRIRRIDAFGELVELLAP